VAGAGTSDLIDWTDDPLIRTLFRSWPARVEAARARRLGLTAEPSFDEIIRAYQRDEAGRTDRDR
jgi:hypothetical protein